MSEVKEEEHKGKTLYRSDRGTTGRRIKFICTKCKDYNVQTMDDNTGNVIVKCAKCGSIVGEIT